MGVEKTGILPANAHQKSSRLTTNVTRVVVWDTSLVSVQAGAVEATSTRGLAISVDVVDTSQGIAVKAQLTLTEVATHVIVVVLLVT